MVLEGRAHVEARLVIPEGQEVVQLVIGHWLGGRSHGVPGGGVSRDGVRTWWREGGGFILRRYTNKINK